MKYEAAVLELSQEEIDLLTIIDRYRTVGVALQDRARIVLDAAAGTTNQQIAQQRNIEEHRVARWRNRWKEQHDPWKKSDPKLRPPMSEKLVKEWLSDKKGRGKRLPIEYKLPQCHLAEASD